MKNIIFLVSGVLLSIALMSCVFRSDFDVEVTIENVSDITYDSVAVNIYPDKDTTFYNVKPKQKLVKVFKYRDFTYSRGERNACAVGAYKDDYYYVGSDGLIDTPYALLQDEYKFYIWDNGLHTHKDIRPQGHYAVKRKISERNKQ